ncbi:Adenylate kinase AAA domain [Trypanosoma vivax]|uniref:Putative adenylate kinase n=1 Tax=Trypanosoma vivax (strain Y486) TaxID=1055687 RepID=G0TW25_TRYVY|nr:putative adenylate kinase [Trypanosoma vivax]KAH8606830.1 Adenylate kinase AAA domain [Trypanosoma vivax]KAH8610604.1 Adenylate kinase AAA domain [Trypanosoma vivax]CCC48141.1 putative adenylate kinase [Trypanosoma vivax Y486]
MSTGQLSAESVAYLEEKRVTYLLEELFHDVLRHLPDNPLEFLLKALEGRTTLHMMIVGPPGCGKQTQSRLIAKKYGAIHVRAEEVFLEEVKRGTEEGQIVEQCMKEGQQIPDHVASELVIKRLSQGDALQNGWVLDGFPQTRSQALRLQTAGLPPLLFVVLDVSSEESVKRCAGRRIDPLTQKIYHMEYFPPTAAVSLELVSPHDESRAAVFSRWKHFDARKDEITGCYEPFFVRIDGERSVDEVFAEICEQIDFRYVSV